MLVGSTPLHASPAEHQATPDHYVVQARGKTTFIADGRPREYASAHLAGNLGPGWIQYRKTLPGEYVEDAA